MIDKKALICMSLLSIQFGLQPTITRRFTPDGVCRSTVVLMQEVLKFCFAFLMLKISGTKQSAVAGAFPLKIPDSAICFETNELYSSQKHRMDTKSMDSRGLRTGCLICVTEYGGAASIPTFRLAHLQCLES